METVSVAAYIRNSQTLILPLIAHGHGRGEKGLKIGFPGALRPPLPIQLSVLKVSIWSPTLFAKILPPSESKNNVFLDTTAGANPHRLQQASFFFFPFHKNEVIYTGLTRKEAP